LAKVIERTDRETLHAEVKSNVEKDSNLFTDEWRSYRGLDADYIHEVINHGVECVRGHIHTNGIENFWSLLKRTIKGTYVSVEPFHLGRYLDEQMFRFNERKGKVDILSNQTETVMDWRFLSRNSNENRIS
jgi:transposase-like protein